MRCPKCGYISFDHLETCKKCRKAIGKFSTELNGTAYDAQAPMFLNIFDETAPEPGIEAVEEVEETFLDESVLDDMAESDEPDDDFILSLEPEAETEEIGEIELSLGSDVEEEKVEEEDVILSLDELDEAPLREEITLDFGEEEKAETEEGPTFDFSDLDISDLMPPGEEGEKEMEAEDLAVEAPVAETVAMELEPEALTEGLVIEESKAAESKGAGLEDLALDALHLDKVGPTASGKRATRSVKTGTALDNFDVDLGELFSEEKK